MAALTTALLVAGAATAAYGGIQQMNAAKGSAGASKNIAGLEIQQDAVRKQQMELTSQRNQMEVLRNAQRSRSLALNNATSQGAQFGSGLQGGYGQIAGQTGVNSLGISQNLALGEQMFGLNAQIGGQKMAQADFQSDAATGAAIAGFGKTLAGIAGPAGDLSKGFSFGSTGPAYSGGGGKGYA